MKDLTPQFWLQMVVYAVSFGTLAGTVITRLNYLEKKMDKHNNVIERVFKVEESAKSAHHRLDDMTTEIKDRIDDLRREVLRCLNL